MLVGGLEQITSLSLQPLCPFSQTTVSLPKQLYLVFAVRVDEMKYKSLDFKFTFNQTNFTKSDSFKTTFVKRSLKHKLIERKPICFRWAKAHITVMHTSLDPKKKVKHTSENSNPK